MMSDDLTGDGTSVWLTCWYAKSSAWLTNLHARYNGLHVYAYLNCVIKFLLQHTDAFSDRPLM